MVSLKLEAKHVVLMLVALCMLMPLLVGVAAPSASQSNGNVLYAGAVKVYRFVYGNLTIYIAYPNTEPVYVYRNVYVVRYDWKHVPYIPYAPPNQDVFMNRIERVKQELRGVGVNIVGWSPYGIIYVDSLSDKEKVNAIIRIVGEHFKDQYANIVIYDSNLENLRMRVADAVLSAEDKVGFLDIYKLDSNSSRHIVFNGGSGFTWSPGGWWFEIGNIKLINMRLNELPADARNWIEQNIKRCVDSWRRYIPEDIPLYVYLFEEFPLMRALPSTQTSQTTPSITTTFAPIRPAMPSSTITPMVVTPTTTPALIQISQAQLTSLSTTLTMVIIVIVSAIIIALIVMRA
jgi:hypothetical protein